MKSSGWVVGEKFFHSKWKAIEYATAHPELPYHAYCHDDTWNRVDWTKEPKETIEDLEIQHCNYLRNKYDTLVLFYSGGVDSHTILQRFIQNKIPIDYICVWYVNDSDAEYNRDTQLAISYLKKNSYKLEKTKILYGKKLDHKEGNSIYAYAGNVFDLNWHLRFHHIGYEELLKLRHPIVYEQVKKNGCIIVGANKPYVYRDEVGKHYVQYVDCDDENWGQPLVEMFYQGKNPTLQIKQCHLAKKWLEENNVDNTNKIYMSNDSKNFFNLNQSFGRIFMDEYFVTKQCFGEMLEDEYFSQHYHPKNSHSIYANYFKFFKESKEYQNLIKDIEKLQKKDPRFFSNYKILGWFNKKRYLD